MKSQHMTLTDADDKLVNVAPLNKHIEQSLQMDAVLDAMDHHINFKIISIDEFASDAKL